MAKQATAKQKYWNGNEQFPILCEDGCLRVFKNPSNEIYVEEMRSGVTMRIGSNARGVLQFTTTGMVEPVQINNMIGWKVTPR